MLDRKKDGIYRLQEARERVHGTGPAPGLIGHGQGFHVLVQVSEHPHNYPHLIVVESSPGETTESLVEAAYQRGRRDEQRSQNAAGSGRLAFREFVLCSLCSETCDPKTAHIHQGKYIGDACCWDERLRSSE